MIVDQFGNPLGWDFDKEDRHKAEIAAMSVTELKCEAPASIPDSLEIPNFLQQGQGSWPFCHSHMRTGCEETLTFLATEGTVLPQYSRKFGAITDMRMDGDDRRATGASIGGSMRAAVKYGAVDEALFPYYRQGEGYSNRIPQEILDQAVKSKIKTLVPNVRSFEQFDAAMVTGLVTSGIGIDWTSGWSNLRGVEFVENYPGGGFLGGHALFFFGWKTRGGERWHTLHNSHPGWGKGSTMRIHISPRVIDRICKTSRYGVIMASDMELQNYTPKPRDFSWLDKSKALDNAHV
jgi:hypothetical protein